MLYEWKNKAKNYQMVGSRVTCSPPPTDTDEDWIVLDLSKSVAKYLEDKGWDNCDQFDEYDDPDTDATIFRADHVNVICLHSTDQYNKFILATRLSKQFNLMRKVDRIALFDAVRYGKTDALEEL